MSSELSTRASFGLATDAGTLAAARRQNADKGFHLGIPLTAPEAREIAFRTGPLDAAISGPRLTAISPATPTPSPGMYLDQKNGGRLHLFFTADAAQRTTELRSVFPYPDRLVTEVAGYTKASLDALVERVSDDVQSLGTAGVVVESVSLSVQANSVDVGLAAAGLDQMTVLRQRYGDAPLRVSAAAAPIPTGGNALDSPPMKGGLWIHSSNAGTAPDCTTGFTVSKNGGNYATTAGHCGSNGTSWYQANSYYVGYLGYNNFYNGSHSDVAIVGPTSVVNLVNIVGNERAIRSGRSQNGDYVGEALCFTAYRIGNVCNQETSTNTTLCYPSGVCIYYLRGTNITGAQGGDSGGSVYSDNTADGSESGTSSGYMYFSTIYDETTNLSMSLVTCCY